MTAGERPVANIDIAKPNAGAWGSDPIAELLRALNFDYISLTPGASFRGLHDSLVNHLGNTAPEILLCLHEEHAVSIAHGYARVTGRPMAVALHANVGLLHASMAIFNAWCDRVPIFMLGAVGPVDAVKRRPWVDWIHTASDLGALIRPYVKWDDQPGSLQAALEAMVRAYRIALTPPRGPVYVCLDAGLQEECLDNVTALPPLERFPAADPGIPSPQSVAAATAALRKASRPVMMIGRVSTGTDDWERRVRLAERLDAVVITDLKTGATFPTDHSLFHPSPGILLDESTYPAICRADVILSLDWVDLGGTLRQACGGAWPAATVIHCSVDEYCHNGFSMDYQALPPADIAILSLPDRLVRALLEVIEPRRQHSAICTPAAPLARARAAESVVEGRISIEALARTTVAQLAPHNPSFLRLPIGWPGEYCRFAHPLDYVGYDGGGGIGSGPGMAVGAALALRHSDRLPVAILGDGDFLMGVTALWSAVNKRIPLLVVVANNQSFFNDELHQERIAYRRNRPVENRSIGVRMRDPEMDLARLAEGQGALGFGPVRTETELAETLVRAVTAVRSGATCVVDVRVAPEYARATSSSIIREMSTAG